MIMDMECGSVIVRYNFREAIETCIFLVEYILFVFAYAMHCI